MKKNIIFILLFFTLIFGFSFSVSAYNFGNTTLINGSKGQAVMELQRFLNDKLNLGLVVDGKLGPKTTEVVKKWQKNNGLIGDGLIGPKTKLKMNSIITNTIPMQVSNKDIHNSLNNSTLTLLYPNGGEVFKDDDEITIKWTGSDLSNISFGVYLKYYDKDNNFITSQELASFVPGVDNQKIVTIPTTLKQIKNVYKVSKYKISIGNESGYDENNFPGDISDNFFTITRLPVITTQYATPSSTSAELNCTYKYQYGTDNPEITFEYGESPCSLTSIDGKTTPNCTYSLKNIGVQTYSSESEIDTTERLFTIKSNIKNLKPNTKYNYQCIVKNNNGQVVGYDISSPTTYVEFNTIQ